MPKAPGGSSTGRFWCIEELTSQSRFARQGRVAAPSIRSASFASCWPLPQQRLPVSATGGGRRCCPYRGEPLAKPFTSRGLPKPPLLGEVARRRRDGEVCYNAAFSAASTTWLTSTEVVTVPTPPGTGVMASTTGSASPKRTSPQSLPSSLTWMPTSTTT